MKNLSLIIMVMSICIFTSCKKSETPATPVPVINPFSNGGDARNMIVIISDLHLGADSSYAECKVNLGPLENLIKQVKVAPNVKELVIAGDLVDEWFVPATVNTFQGKDQADFVKRLATANKGVFDALNSVIQEGKILVTYLPGNHDLVITAADIESVLPGISQARDNVLGLGTYSPVDCPKIAIEHGHRYNFFCAPDPISNQDIAPGTILPPGYFFTRIAALCVEQKNPPPGDTLPVVTQNTSGDESQDLLFRYWKQWDASVVSLPITNRFDEKIIITHVNGFTGTYSVNDLVPFQLSPGGYIDVDLSHGIQDNWEARQNHNHVAVHITAAEAIDSVMSDTEVDHQANVQYFMNTASDKRIVVFGHTHVPRIDVGTSYDNKKCIYANSGTWIDNNPKLTTMNFVVITPQTADPSSQTLVKLYNFEQEVVTQMAADSVRY
jgi:UDP-2,3-diacylglucosamine pyrophosphatase LpxH